jgi:hypothetical protein
MSREIDMPRDEETVDEGTMEEREPAREEATVESGGGLFVADRATELRRRWMDVQARFVDDPRSAVKEADGLVGEVIADLTTSFREERARLDEELGGGEQLDTERLRVAVRRYRSFFERLLAV